MGQNNRGDRKSHYSHCRSTSTFAMTTTTMRRPSWRQKCGVRQCAFSVLLAIGLLLLYVTLSPRMHKKIRQVVGPSMQYSNSSKSAIIKSEVLGSSLSSSSSQTMNDTTMEDAIEHLVQLNINFVALDFDLTVIDVHTGGRWKKSTEELVHHHVRPEFRQLILSCLNQDIHVAIVTFTPQTQLVKSVMQDIVGVERVNRIPIRGEDDTWSYHGDGSQVSLKGKQAHMASAVEELITQADGKVVEINKNTMILIDDDERNIRYASKNGIRGIWFIPDKPHYLIRDLARLE